MDGDSGDAFEGDAVALLATWQMRLADILKHRATK